MTIELRVPTVGESITEVQIGDWLKRAGEDVRRDEPLVVIDTDKVTVEIVAPADGRLVTIVLEKGASARVGDVVGIFEAGVGLATNQAPPLAASSPPPAAVPSTPKAVAEGPVAAAEGPVAAAEGPKVVASSVLPPEPVPWAGPAARRALAEHGLSAETVAASGRGGRLLKEDVERYLAETPSPASPALVTPAVAPVHPDRPEELVAMSPFRRRVAERLLAAQHQAALLTTFNEVDMSAVQQLRHDFKEEFERKWKTKLGLMSFFVKATVEALKATPAINAEIRGNDIVYKNYYDIGVAVGGGRGLVVPVLRNVERMGFSDVERTISDFGVRAKANRIALDELQGGTFSITNGGVYGSMLSTPIVNPPQSGILGLHAITERPVAKDGVVVIRPMMYVALTYDHRIVDGREAVTFLKSVKSYIENPTRILLEL